MDLQSWSSKPTHTGWRVNVVDLSWSGHAVAANNVSALCRNSGRVAVWTCSRGRGNQLSTGWRVNVVDLLGVVMLLLPTT